MVEQLNTNRLAGMVLASLLFQEGDSAPGAFVDSDGNPLTFSDDPQTGTEGAAAETEGLLPGQTRTVIDPVTGRVTVEQGAPVGSDAESTKRFSSIDPYTYNLVREFVIENYFGGDPEGRDTTIVGSFVNAWAERLGTEGEDGEIAYPDLRGFVSNPTFNQGAAFLPYAGQIPETQIVSSDPTEEGNAVLLRLTYDPLEGLQQEEVDPGTFFGSQTPGVTPSTGEAGQETAGQAGERTIFEIGMSEVANLNPDILAKLDPQTQAALTGNATITNAQGNQVTILPEVIPISDYLQQFLKPPDPPRTRGGGGVEPKIDFDRRKLIQQASDRWRQVLWEDPNQARIGSLVDDYIAEATGFWRQSGGRIIDYQSFVREQLEGTSRYKTIYRFKPQDVEVDDFINQMASPIGQLGLEPGRARNEQFAAVQSGGSAVGQLSRVSNLTSAGRAATNFSRRFAETLKGLGAGGAT